MGQGEGLCGVCVFKCLCVCVRAFVCVCACVCVRVCGLLGSVLFQFEDVDSLSVAGGAQELSVCTEGQ